MIQRLAQCALLAVVAAAIAASVYLMVWPPGLSGSLQGTSCTQGFGPWLWPLMAGDVFIGLASLGIAAGLMRWMGRRQGIPFHWPIVVLAAVVLSGGLAHWVELWLAWQDKPGVPRLLSGTTSILTAGALVHALPGLWNMPAFARLTGAGRPIPPAEEGESLHRLDPLERSLLEERVRQRTAELQAATETARSALVDAEQADRLKDTFLAMASHELRTPLQSTLYWADMLRRNNTPGHAAEAASHIIHNVHVQSRLIDDLLDISRILTGQLRLEWRLCDPVDVVEKAAEVVRAEAGVRGITLQLHRPAQQVSMSTDPVRLEQVAWNLMSNAVHASPDGAAIEVTMQTEPQVFRLVVQDSGVGIEPSQLVHIFETFHQGKQGKRQGGLGLGLPITRSIVRQFDGRIEAFSEGPGQGARFTVELPMRGAALAHQHATLQASGTPDPTPC